MHWNAMPPVDPNSSALRNQVRAWHIATLPTLPTLPALAAPPTTELFVWFENTASRRARRGIGLAGMPECLLPVRAGLRVLERHFAYGHAHLLAAARFACRNQVSERIADIYVAALGAGTLAWIGIGPRYQQPWNEIFPRR
jgi:hypothetical protein